MAYDKVQRIVIIGGGGHAREVFDVVEAINAVKFQYKMLGFIVDTQYGAPGTLVSDKPILGDFSWFEQNSDVQAICAVGATQIRRRLALRAETYGVKFCTLIHPTATLTSQLTIGHGSLIPAGCILTNQIQIGNHVHLNIGATISHDCILEDYVTVSPGVHCAGNVTLEEGCFVGIGASVIEKKTIRRWSTIGAGSVIISDTPANSTVVGIPGQVIKVREEGWHLA